MKKKKINKRLLYALKIVQKSKVILAEKQLAKFKEDNKNTFLKNRRMGASGWVIGYIMGEMAIELKYKNFINKWKIK
tara:strand:+ start:5072 stop:5302 length:231 start_codon:yes stop_codon:yes gene_type:complete